MADLDSRNVNTKFSGLTTTVALFGVVGAVALIGFETLRQTRRLPKTTLVPFWKRDILQRQGGRGGVDPRGDDRGGNVIGTREKLTCEDWEMGHLYQARQFHATAPSPTMARWPLAWAWQALKFDDWFYATHTGMDTVVYVRFLRACMWWMLLQTLTTAPILLAIHFHFAVKSHGDHGLVSYNNTQVINQNQGPVSLNDMSQASLSYLVTTTICHCANGTLSLTPCNDQMESADSSTKSQFSAYRNCDHVPNAEGRKLLWIHLCLLWYMTFSWFYALWWIGKGSLHIRRRWIEELRSKRQQAIESNQASQVRSVGQAEGGESADTEARQQPEFETRHILEEKHGFGNLVRGDDHDGWRQRTLLVTNLPPTMRDEASIRRYFEEFLRPDDGSSVASVDEDEMRERNASNETETEEGGEEEKRSSSPSPLQDDGDVMQKAAQPPANQSEGPGPDMNPDRHLRSPVQTVVLVRKMNELSAMLSRRQEVLGRLEAAHIKLAQAVMSKVGRNATSLRRNEDEQGRGGGMGGLGKGRANNSRLLRSLRRANVNGNRPSKEDIEKEAAAKLSEERMRLDELTRRLARFSPNNRGMHTREAQLQGDEERGGNEMTETVWEALSQVPRDLLDPYQPVTRLSSLFRGQKVPTIDYLLTKLNLLTALVTEMRARPPSSYEATSTAFVTFRDPRQARMVWRELKTQIVVKVRLAPEVKDLDWERLMRTSFTGDIVRGLGVNVFFWAFTILWVVPVTLLTTSLFSVEKLEAIFPPLHNFFNSNPRFEGFISVTLPTLIVSLLTLSVPELIFQISKRAQGFVTFSALYDQCLCRYWKFIICNVVIFFCIGATTVQSILFQLGTNNNVLNAVAFSFPTAAPFYISYLILGMGMHTGFELLGFMVPLIQHLGARNASTPRSRALKTLPRNFNRYYWLPLHILIMSIVFLFALLNPLVIPFAMVYIWVALAVFKKNFAYQYFRRFNEKEGVIYYARLLRFSLDGLLLAQVVLLIFFSVTRQEAAYIGLTAVLLPISVTVKLLGTRLWKSQCRAVEDEEANALCGIGSSQPLTPSVQRDYMGENSMYGQAEQHGVYASPLDARATGRYPAVVIAPPMKSRLANLWNKIHDSFNANGNDRPSYLAGQHMHGSRLSAKTVTHAVASGPVAVAKRTAKRSQHIAQATSVAAKVPANGFKLRKSLAVSSTFPVREEQEVSSPDQATDVPLAGASARDLRLMLEGTEETSRKIKSAAKRTMSGHRRRKSDEAPFLSGYDAIANHAPVLGSDDGSISSLDDGEFEEVLSLQRRQTFAKHQRRRSQARRSASMGHNTRSAPRHMTLDDTEEVEASVGEDPLHADLKAHGTGSVQMPQTVHGEKGLGYLGKGTDSYDVTEDSDYEDSLDGGPLVRPHAKVRWDDTPNNHARYNNPFYSVELDPFLWLPRDPLAPIDLCDTIEWHGPALVSSQGGLGRVGEWDDEEGGAEEIGDEQGDFGEMMGEERAHHAGDHSMAFQGDEQIEISGALAQRIQEAEDLDEVADPTASIPRNQLDGYKRALDEDQDVTEEMQDVHSLTSSPRIRSPRRTASVNRRSASIVGFELPAPVTTTPRKTSDPSAVGSPDLADTVGRRLSVRTQRRNPSTAASMLSVESTGNGGSLARTGHVSMRRALKAEVLEEEYLRAVKERVARQSRRSENVSTLSTTKEDKREEADTATEMSIMDSNGVGASVQRSSSAIVSRHERKMHRHSPSQSRDPLLSPSRWSDKKQWRAEDDGPTGVSRSMSGSTYVSTQGYRGAKLVPLNSQSSSSQPKTPSPVEQPAMSPQGSDKSHEERQGEGKGNSATEQHDW